MARRVKKEEATQEEVQNTANTEAQAVDKVKVSKPRKGVMQFKSNPLLNCLNMKQDVKKVKREINDMQADLLAKMKIKRAAPRKFLPWPWLAMQYATSTIGVHTRTLTEIYGLDSVGKSTMVYSLLAHFVKLGCIGIYINTESKELLEPWRLRICGPDPNVAEIVDAMIAYVDDLKSYEEVDTYLKDAPETLRERLSQYGVTKDTHCVIVIDSIGGLVTEAVKKGVEENKSLDQIGQQMLAGTKWLHNWTRALNSYMAEHNATFIITNSSMQNIKNMMQSEKNNRSKFGGEALNQKTALQLKLTGTTNKIDSKPNCKAIMMTCHKNSNGSVKGREITYLLKESAYPFADVEGVYKEVPICMGRALCDVLLNNDLFGITASMGRYKSEALGIEKSATPAEVEQVFNQNADFADKFGKAMVIGGYEEDGEEDDDI